MSGRSLMLSLLWVGVVSAASLAPLAPFALAELQVPCAAAGAKGVLRSCDDFKKDFWAKLVGQFQRKWQEGIQAGKNPYEEGATLRACNLFASELGLTSESDTNRAFNVQPEDGDRCGSWGKIISRNEQGWTNRKVWRVALYDPSREGALWSGMTEVYFVEKALLKVLKEVQAGALQEPASLMGSPAIADYKKLRQEVAGLSVSGSSGNSVEALDACKKPGPGSNQKACYSAATGVRLEDFFLRISEMVVAALQKDMTEKLRSAFLTDGQLDRNASDRLVDHAIDRCGRNKKGESCRQSKYQERYLELLKSAVQQAVSQVTGQ